MIWLLFGRAIASRSFDHVGFDECFDVDVDVDVDAIASRSFDHMDYDDCFYILRIEDNERAFPV